MTSLLVALALFVGTVGWFLLALVPALHEHFGRSDVGPLRVASSSVDIRFFALSFQQFIDRQLVALRADTTNTRPRVTSLADGSGVWYAPPSTSASDNILVFADASAEAIANGLVVISERRVYVPFEGQVLKELYTGEGLTSESGGIFRAILAGADVDLAAGCEVLRWVHAGGTLTTGSDCTLWGRASSVGMMALGDGTRFQRLAAQRVEFGWPVGDRPSIAANHEVMTPPGHAKVFASRWVVDGDLEIPAGQVLPANLVVSGRLTVARGAHVGGAVRAETIVAHAQSVFSSSVVATKSLVLDVECLVNGPVVVEGEAVFGDRCHIGELATPTSISASAVKVGNGVVLHGEIWVRRQGVVVPLPSNVALAPAA